MASHQIAERLDWIEKRLDVLKDEIKQGERIADMYEELDQLYPPDKRGPRSCRTGCARITTNRKICSTSTGTCRASTGRFTKARNASAG